MTYKQRVFKKALGTLWIVAMFLSMITNVYASTLTIKSFEEHFTQTETMKSLAELGSAVTTQINETNKTLDIYSEEELVFSLNYGEDYIEYDNRSVVVTEDNYDDSIIAAIFMYNTLETVLDLSGYEDKTVSEETVFDAYDTYGIQVESEAYSFSGTDENGGSWSADGDYIKYFKVSLDTEKIDALMAKYGIDIEDPTTPSEEIANLIPRVSATEITENTIKIAPKVEYDLDESEEKMVYCYIYRSNSVDGTYEKISDMAVNCLGSVSVIDEGLKSNTTYYYKAIVDGGKNFGEPIAVTTKGSAVPPVTPTPPVNNTTNNDTNNDTNTTETPGKKNPETGISYPLVSMLLIMAMSTGVVVYTKKKSIFKQY